MQEPKNSFSRLGLDLGDTKAYDKAYDNAKNLFKDYVKTPVDAKYDQKEIEISYRIQNGIFGDQQKEGKQIHKIKSGKKDLFAKTSKIIKAYKLDKTSSLLSFAAKWTLVNEKEVEKYKENTDYKNNKILDNGLTLLANRNDVFGPAYSYPKTFVINTTNKIESKLQNPISHIKDIHRIITITPDFKSSEDSTNLGQINLLSVTLDVIDLFHNASKINKTDIAKIDVPSSHHRFVFLSNSKTVPDAVKGAFGYGKYFGEDIKTPMISENEIDKTYKQVNQWKETITNSTLFNITRGTKTTHTIVDEMLIDNKQYDNSDYKNPQSDLAIAALYITDFYMRNQEPPEQNADKVTSYLLNNFDHIEALTRVSMYIGKFPITAPIEDEQYEYTIPSGQLDDQKFESIDAFLNKPETRKALGIKSKINSNMTPQMLLAKKMLKIQKLQNEIEYLKKNPVIATTTAPTIESKEDAESEKEELESNMSSNDFIDNLSQFSEEE